MYKLVVGVLAATMTIAACGGSSKKDSTPAAGGSTTTTAADGSGSSTTGAPGGGSDDLSKLAAQYAKAKIKITYTSNSGDNASTFTIAQDGNGKSAFTTDGNTFYSDGKSSISCEGTGTSAKCTDLGSLGGATAGIGSMFTASFSSLAAVFSSLGVGDKSSDTIAGRDASCVKYKASDLAGKLAALPLFKGDVNSNDYDPNDSATICVDKNTGFLLKISSTKKGTEVDNFVATDVGEPSDSDFTPPVTPETIPSIPGVPTIPGN